MDHAILIHLHPFRMGHKVQGALFEDQGIEVGSLETHSKYALENGIHVDFVGGHSDHCHCLVSLGATQSAAEVVRLIKGESSNHINRSGICKGEFAWQQGYYAASVSFASINSVREYIKNQEEHYKEKAFSDEYEQFLLRVGFQKVDLDWS